MFPRCWLFPDETVVVDMEPTPGFQGVFALEPNLPLSPSIQVTMVIARVLL